MRLSSLATLLAFTLVGCSGTPPQSTSSSSGGSSSSSGGSSGSSDASASSSSSSGGVDAGPQKRTVFIASNFAVDGSYFGTDPAAAGLGPRNFASVLCNNTANGAKLAGTYEAWVSGPGPDIQPIDTTVDWYLPDGRTLVLKAGSSPNTLLHAIDQNAKGEANTSQFVWTGLGPAGAAAPNCNGWSDKVVMGTTGNPTATDSTWTADKQIGCGRLAAFYCFQRK
ncbi:MAG: hypothetical protein HOO96_18240 [Polyangiaceae bacterium]|nr:hypothetical protein [Polyangiaceae bacterium]